MTGRLAVPASRAVLVAVSLVALGPACGERAPPARLADGNAATHVRVALDGVGQPTVLTRARVVGLPRRDPLTASCAGQNWSEPTGGPAVVRIGVDGESVTLGSHGQDGLHGCDASASSRRGHRWCGASYGMLSGGHLRDPRLDLGACTTPDGRPIAFAWVDPRPGTRYVVVRRQGFAEVYETAAALPVRVAATENVDVQRSRARFRISEHTASGALVDRYQLTARTAG